MPRLCECHTLVIPAFAAGHHCGKSTVSAIVKDPGSSRPLRPGIIAGTNEHGFAGIRWSSVIPAFAAGHHCGKKRDPKSTAGGKSFRPLRPGIIAGRDPPQRNDGVVIVIPAFAAGHHCGLKNRPDSVTGPEVIPAFAAGHHCGFKPNNRRTIAKRSSRPLRPGIIAGPVRRRI